jgi:hypothetical protein
LLHRRHRQERWLHTRISETLEHALKREARRRRLPVSLLVRNVLEGALELVEDLVEGGFEVARRSQDLARAVSEPGVARHDDVDDVYGWQEIVLNRDGACARCATALAAGAPAHRGLRESPGPPVFLCASCIAALRGGETRNQEETSP